MDSAINCLFCSSTAISPVNRLPVCFNARQFGWNQCRHCGLIFLWPGLSDEDKNNMYDPVSYHGNYYFNYTEDYTSQLKLAAPYNKKTLLDYGCGDAGLASFFQQHGYAVSAVEYNPLFIFLLKANAGAAMKNMTSFTWVMCWSM
jgi:SAM-dependent methyltransferase